MKNLSRVQRVSLDLNIGVRENFKYGIRTRFRSTAVSESAAVSVFRIKFVFAFKFVSVSICRCWGWWVDLTGFDVTGGLTVK